MAQLKLYPCKTQQITNKKWVKISNHINVNGNCEVHLTIKNWAMVQCNIAFCALKYHYNYNNHSVVIFNDLKKPKERMHWGEASEHSNKKNSITLCQNEAWMCAINYVHENVSVVHSDNTRHMMCLHYYHPVSSYAIQTIDIGYKQEHLLQFIWVNAQ